jgi:hypothetical protein
MKVATRDYMQAEEQAPKAHGNADEVLSETAQSEPLPRFHFATGKSSRFGMTSMKRW